MTHLEWFTKITAGDSVREVARRSSIPPKTLANQVNAGELKADLIIKIAEAYDESPVIALVDLGFMSAKWITEPGVVTALTRASDEQLTNELLGRLRLIEDVPVDELAAKRSNKQQAPVDPMPYDAVADSSPDEDELRAQEEGDVD